MRDSKKGRCGSRAARSLFLFRFGSNLFAARPAGLSILHKCEVFFFNHIDPPTINACTRRTLSLSVDAAFLAVHKARNAGNVIDGAVLGSDAYFPFRDGIDQAAEAGVKAIVQPGGSVRDPEVIAAADEHGIAMVFTGTRLFRH